jgi:hypothetical protein
MWLNSFSSYDYFLSCFFKFVQPGGEIENPLPVGQGNACVENRHLSSSYPRGRGWAVSGGRPGLALRALQLRDSAGLSFNQTEKDHRLRL